MTFLSSYFSPPPHTRHELAVALMIWPPVGILFGLLLWKILLSGYQAQKPRRNNLTE